MPVHTIESPPLHPIVNMNGDSAESLLADRLAALGKLREAIDALNQCAPNGRNYQTLEDHRTVLRHAQRQHDTRMMSLHAIQLELTAEAENISDQQDRRKAR